MSLRAVLFDLDGTLIDTAPDFVKVLQQMLIEENRPALPAAAIRAAVSHGSPGLVKLGFGIVEGDPDYDRLRSRLLNLYTQHLADTSLPFDGIESLISQLQERGLHWGIATNKPSQYATPLIQALALQPDCLICPDHVSQRKPHPESLHLAAQQLQCEPQQMVYVGDHERDIECGNRAGCITIAARYGYIGEEQDPSVWQATHEVNDAGEIWPLLQQYL